MNLDQVKFHVNAYRDSDQIMDAANFLVRNFNLGSDNLEGFGFRDELVKDTMVLTTEGEVGEKQVVMIPKNIFDFDFNLVINMIAHEMLHVRQKSPEHFVEDKNEREFQAYYEMLFHKVFTKVPDSSDFHKKIFGNKALEYYRRMGEGSELQQKYVEQKKEVEELLSKLN